MTSAVVLVNYYIVLEFLMRAPWVVLVFQARTDRHAPISNENLLRFRLRIVSPSLSEDPLVIEEVGVKKLDGRC